MGGRGIKGDGVQERVMGVGGRGMEGEGEVTQGVWGWRWEEEWGRPRESRGRVGGRFIGRRREGGPGREGVEVTQ